ncbi:MAG: hypothetical protein KIT00_06095 [Rhodospirillales bacterium]|nr:hypothetical protein [Rhodospirillales bacterium]
MAVMTVADTDAVTLADAQSHGARKTSLETSRIADPLTYSTMKKNNTRTYAWTLTLSSHTSRQQRRRTTMILSVAPDSPESRQNNKHLQKEGRFHFSKKGPPTLTIKKMRMTLFPIFSGGVFHSFSHSYDGNRT